MEKIKDFIYSKYYIELVIASILFIVAFATDSMIEVIIALLYFIIMLEVVRAVMSFLRERQIQIIFLINAFIILALREFIVNVVKINKEEITSIDALLSSSTNFHILIFGGVLLFLFVLRWLSIITSPDKIS